ncbi:YIP1 family protein [Candidatus Bathyarchaeota archaeon]|nr:YIP1 family protein [Candidatus Bathyarchaeota archaeon]
MEIKLIYDIETDYSKSSRLNKFFKSKNENHFWISFSIVLLTTIFNVGTIYLSLVRSTNTSLQTGRLIAFPILIGFFGWILSNLLYHGFSLLFGVQGSFKRMLTLSGYAFFPILIQEVTRLLFFLISGEIPGTLIVGQGIIRVLIENFTIFRIITIVLTFYAISENYKLSLKKSALVALLPILIIIVLRVVFSSFFNNIGITRPRLFF